jgi:hypothetical protein
MNWNLPLDERPPGLVPDVQEQKPRGDADATTGSEALPPPVRGGHSIERQAAIAASLNVLRAALRAHVALVSFGALAGSNAHAGLKLETTLLRRWAGRSNGV